MAFIAPRTWIATNILTAAQLNIDIRDNEEFLKAYISPDKTTLLTIAAGVITVTQTYHRVDTSGPAEEDLRTIADVSEGQIVILRAENAARIVVLKAAGGNLKIGNDISLDDTDKHVALICDADTNMQLLYSARDVTFMANAFQYPVPATEWKPNTGGACLPASQGGKVVYLPLNFLKIGDVIISYNLTGSINGAGATLDCELLQVDLTHPVGTTPIGNGFIAQQSDDAIFDATASVDDITVATDKMYYLLITGTTDAGETITVMGAEVLIRRLV